jgi:hypothetical protein
MQSTTLRSGVVHPLELVTHPWLLDNIVCPWPLLPRTLLPEGSATLEGWRSSAPLLIMGSHEWNTPDAAGNLSCNGKRQERVLAAAQQSPPAAAGNRGGKGGYLCSCPVSWCPVYGTHSGLVQLSRPFVAHSGSHELV